MSGLALRSSDVFDRNREIPVYQKRLGFAELCRSCNDASIFVALSCVRIDVCVQVLC